ncbi:MAG: hypothetical protein CXZ00_05760 [Acidobacteria bacterium]|nr:MAG: hypothetical protein CXZ00_05760 [Acidobacteriota bacterium]
MREGFVLCTLVAALTAQAVSQQIVIEPTNGRPQSATRVVRPPAAESAPAQAKKRAGKEQVAKPPKPQKVSVKQIASKPKPAPVEMKKEVISEKTEEVKHEAPKAISAGRKMAERPEWAMTDTRDPHSLQIEIAGALARDPKLARSSIQVSVNDEAVILEGRAAGPEERLQAVRLAHSYAWNRKVVTYIGVMRETSAQKAQR